MKHLSKINRSAINSMSRPLFVTLLSLLSALSSARAYLPMPSQRASENPMLHQVREGLSLRKDEAPAAVQKIWNAVFTLISSDTARTRHGTAFLMHTRDLGETMNLYFITNQHVVDMVCPERDCSKAVLMQNMDLEIGQYAEFKSKANVLSGVNVIRISDKKVPDLAILRVQVPKGKVTAAPLNFQIDCKVQRGETLYTVGFPNVTRRTYKERLPIEKQNTITKRWSQGLYFDEASTAEPGEILLNTSIDSLPGSSGGPIVNAEGELVGVAIGTSAGVYKQDERYVGVEEGDSPRSHLKAIRCDDLANFISPDK